MDESRLREVVVTRSDDRGYGLTVSGESPVTVQIVKEGGPACQAGVQVGDCIMKVNGTPVSKFNHKEVVQIIKSSHSVRLTVCAGVVPPAEGSSGQPPIIGSPMEGGGGGMASVLLRHHNKDKITAPLPVNNQLQIQMDVNRHKMLSKMLDTQLKTRENILAELQKVSSKSMQKTLDKKLESINKQVATIQDQLRTMERIDAAQLQSSSSSSRRSPALSRSSFPFPPPSSSPSYHPYLPSQPLHNRHHHHLSQYQLQFLQDQHHNPPLPPPVPPQSHQHLLLQQQQQKKPFQKAPKQQQGHHHKHTRSASEIPPPLPARNRGLFSQVSAPNMTMSMTIPSVSVTNTEEASSDAFINNDDNCNDVTGSSALVTGGRAAQGSGIPTSASASTSVSCDDLNNLRPSSSTSVSSMLLTNTPLTSTTLSQSSLSSTSTTSTSLSTAETTKSKSAAKSSSFNMKPMKGSTSLSASPSCVSTLSAPPNLCPPPLPPRPACFGGGKDSWGGDCSPLEGSGAPLSSLETAAVAPARQARIAHSVSSVSEGGGGRSTSQHCRAKSSPEAITPHSQQQGVGGRRLSGSDSLVDLTSLTSSNSNNSNRSSSAKMTSALIEDEPPGTPPPPYINANNLNNNSSNNSSSCHAASNSNAAEDEATEAGDSGSNTTNSTAPCGNAQAAGDGGAEASAAGDCEGGAGVDGSNARTSRTSLEDDDDNYCTIPDEGPLPPPFMGGGGAAAAAASGICWTQQNIQSMEDDDFSDQEAIEDHGPFQALNQLFAHPAYLAVFMNYIISNCAPATLFFYLITDLYKEGAAKEMKKWAYEIHSSFLLPGAPMMIKCPLEDTVLHEIDETLRHELDKEETLRRVFRKARKRARVVLNEQLADFRSKRTAGLGNIFGPPDPQLQESKHNKSKEMAIIESVLVPFLDSVSDEWKDDDHSLMMASSLATILWKWFNVKSPKAMVLIDRCPLYVNKDRPLRNKLFKASKKQLVRDHCFNQLTFYSVSYCNHCQDVIWGIAPQGYQCAYCEMNIHKSCAKLVEELCIGQVRKKPPRDKKLPSFLGLGKIIPDDRDNKRKSSQIGGNIPMDKRRGGGDDDAMGTSDYFGNCHQQDSADGCSGGDKNNSSSSSACTSGLGGNPSNSTSSGALPLSTKDSVSSRRSDSLSSHHGGHSANHLSNSHHHHHHHHPSEEDGAAGGGADGADDEAADAAGADVPAGLPDATKTALRFLQTAWSSQAEVISSGKSNLHKKKSGNPINRSESYKEKHPRRVREDRRKHSDPNIPTSKAGDVDGEPGLHHYPQSGSSSNSSLSQSLDSPSLSLEQVTAREVPQLLDPQLNNDSDVEVEADLPDWTCNVPPEQLAALPSRERKRQDTINELFHTEQTHVRLLKVMHSLFYNPLRTSGLLTDQHLNLLFPNLQNMLKLHSIFNEAMKTRRREQPVVTTIGDILTAMFEGSRGENFEREAAEFVRSQSIGLEGLKLSKKRDQKLASFLQERENHPLCRRLQLKDMLPAGFQRLSKYPLLLESLLGYTDLDKYPDEYDQINRCLDRCREILASVNAAVREEENNQRLVEIQKRLDQSAMAKNKQGHTPEETGNLDLTKHRLIYEGPLSWRVPKGPKNLDLHVLILDEMLVLLQKDSDKYVLKTYSINKSSGKEDKLMLSPIIKIDKFLFREVATDKCAFFIITTQTSSIIPQICEFVTSSINDRKTWFRHFQETQTNYENRDGRSNRRSQQPGSSGPPHDSDGDAAHGQHNQDRDGGDEADLDNTDAPYLADGAPLTPATPNTNNNNNSADSPSTDPLASKSEHLRRKDMKIKQALEEKQHLIADILGIAREDFETLADMAGEPSGAQKEPRELVLAAIYQANCLQETLNEALTVRESDIVAAKAGGTETRVLPLYPAPMNKLMNIAGSLSQQLNSLLNMVSERDDERDRMRKELVASRERLHQLHLNQSGAAVNTPTNSRPSSFLSQCSSSTPEQQHREEGDAAQQEERPRTKSVQEELSELLLREANREDTPVEGSEAAATDEAAAQPESSTATEDTTEDSSRGVQDEPDLSSPPAT